MKNIKLTSALLCIVLLISACGSGLFGEHIYSSDAELGSGARIVKVKISDPDLSVTFTLHTDAKTVGDALIEHKLIDGEPSEFGLFIKVANGIRADYTLDGAYWAFSKDGEYMLSGVDSTEFADNDTYELTYTKS